MGSAPVFWVGVLAGFSRRLSRSIVALLLGLVVVAGFVVVPMVGQQTWSDEMDTAPSGGDLATDQEDADADMDPDGADPEPRTERTWRRLKEGQRPPQFVVLSVDGGCEQKSGVIYDLLRLGRDIEGRFTFFLSGLCIVPENRRMAYRPPKQARGASTIGFGERGMTKKRLDVLARTYREGHEIGTHFLGHFCGATGVDIWSTKDWLSEIRQARGFLNDWPVFNPKVRSDPLPFDWSVVVGGRTPCLAGDRPKMMRAFAEAGFRYDASDPGWVEWPKKGVGGKLWEFPLPTLHVSGTGKSALAMDYNFMAVQTNGFSVSDPQACARIRGQAKDTYMNVLKAANAGSRAPIIIGTHLNSWSCNAYIDSLHDFARAAKKELPKVEFVSFAELADWLDAQDPKVLAQLQRHGPVPH